MNELLTGVRRRLRLTWALATVQQIGPVLAAVALAFVVLGRMRPWGWPEPAAAALGFAVLAAVTLRALTLPIPLSVAARAADRGLQTLDTFATALELRDQPPFGARVAARADTLAAGRRPADVVPWPFRRRRMATVAVLLVAATVLAMGANVQDRIRREREAQLRLLDAEAAALRQAASELRPDGATASRAGVAQRLEELARRLSSAGELGAGVEAARAAADDLARRLAPDLLAQKAAVRGLERSLASARVSGTTGDAATQLQALAGELAGLDAATRSALVARLSALAGAQAVGNPDASEALGAAAEALAAGDLPTAAEALTDAAAAHRAGTASVADQEAAAAGMAAASASSDRLAAAQQGSTSQGQERPARGQPGREPGDAQGRGQAQGEGQGRGQGRGQGQGQGQGQGRGQGQGQGRGQGQGSGSPSGVVGGTNAPTGAGRGGAAAPAGGTGRNPSVGLQTATVYNPVGSSPGDSLTVGGAPNEGPTTQTATGAAPTRPSAAQVPLADVVPRYQAEATRALDRGAIPPAQRGLVSAYFAGLSEQA